jgi:hypothetical protein
MNEWFDLLYGLRILTVVCDVIAGIIFRDDEIATHTFRYLFPGVQH